MKLNISIDMDNAAFDSSAREELVRIFRDIANRLYERRSLGKILDINGNSVGWVRIVR